METFNKQSLTNAVDRLIRDKGGYSTVSEATGIKADTLRNWGKGVEPRLFGFITLMQYLGATDGILSWVQETTGEQSESDTEIVQLPLYDVTLSAGNGSLNDRGEVIGQIPMTLTTAQGIAGRGDISNLGMFRASGDSMLPSISDGDLVVVDQRFTEPGDGIFAFVMGGQARIKRLQIKTDGIDVISDNSALYQAETLPMDGSNEISIIGRVIWRMGDI